MGRAPRLHTPRASTARTHPVGTKGTVRRNCVPSSLTSKWVEAFTALSTVALSCVKAFTLLHFSNTSRSTQLHTKANQGQQGVGGHTLCRRLNAIGCSLGLSFLPLLYGYRDCGVRWGVHGTHWVVCVFL
jgi:hypothetical protein